MLTFTANCSGAPSLTAHHPQPLPAGTAIIHTPLSRARPSTNSSLRTQPARTAEGCFLYRSTPRTRCVQKGAGFSHGTGLLTGPVQPEGRFLYGKPHKARAEQKRWSIPYGKRPSAEPNGLASRFRTAKAGFPLPNRSQLSSTLFPSA